MCFRGATIVLERAEHGVGDDEIAGLGEAAGGVIREIISV
jgi:hypothetical protein